jgi:uncharacterized protein (TIGR00255 family)
MIYSMTGFGKATATIGNVNIIIEIKSVNGKASDIFIRQPSIYNEKEIWLRQYLLEKLHRGTIQVNIFRQDSSTASGSFNNNTIAAYYKHALHLANELQADTSGLFSQLITLPDCMQSNYNSLTEEEFICYKSTVKLAIEHLQLFRTAEGTALMADFVKYTGFIEEIAKIVTDLAPNRVQKIKDSLQLKLQNWQLDNATDQNRFEQELIYYLEKLDVNEELTRLATHINYFQELLANNETTKGKKIGFVLQEMGREINTLGSKANDASIQHLVIKMKNELEKMKEQALNIL